MPDKFDASINIDSRIKTDNFKKGTKEISDSIDKIEKKVKEAGEDLKDVGKIDTRGSRKELEELGRVSEDAAKAVDDSLSDIGAAWESYISDVLKEFESISDIAKEVGNDVDSIGDRAGPGGTREATEDMKIVVPAEIDTEEYEQGSERLKSSVDSLRDRFKSVGDTIKEAAGFFGKALRDEVSATESSLRKDFANIFDKPNRDAEKFRDTLESLRKSAATEGEPVTPYTQGWDQAFEKMKEAPRITEMAKGAVIGALTEIGNTAGSVMANATAIVNQPLDAVNQALGAVSTKGLEAAGSLSQIAKGAVISGLKSIASHAKSAAASLVQMAGRTVISGLNRLKASLSGVNKGVNFNGKSFKKALMMVLRYGLGIRGLFQLFRKLRRAISEGLDNVATYDTQFKATMDDFKNAVTTLKNAVGSAVAPIAQMVIPVITNIIYAITEGINKFAMLTAALTGAKSYLKATKAQTNAYQQEAKAAKEAQKTIAGFDDLVILQENEESDSGGADSGQPSGFEMTPITDGIKDLADALKDMWNKADFTDLGRMLGERLRDALNSIPWDSIKELMRKIGKSIATFLNGFLETPGLFDAIGRTIAQALNSAFEFVYAFVTNFHWDSLGRAIVEGILGFVNNIDWTLIKNTFAALGTGIATTIGTIVSDPNLPIGIGNALAQVVNTAFLFLLNFVSTIPWAEVGNFIRTGLLSILTNIDWLTIYQTFSTAGTGIADALNAALADPNLWTKISVTVANAINAIFLGLYNLVSKIQWADIGKSIGIGFNNGVTEFPWAGIGMTISTALNGLFAFLLNWVTTVDWKALGSSIGTSISYAITTFDWNTAGASLGALFQALCDLLVSIITTIDWAALGRGIIEFVSGFFGQFDWSSVGGVLLTLVTGLFNFLTGALQAVDWVALPGKIIEAFTNYMTGFDWGAAATAAMNLLAEALKAAIELIVGILIAAGGAIFEAGSNLTGGLLGGIADGLVAIATWINDNVFTPIMDAIKSLFGIQSPSTVMASIGGFIVEGLLGGILEPLKNIFKWLDENVAGPIVNGVKKLFGIGNGKTALEDPGSAVTNGLKKGMGGAMNGISRWVKGNVTDPVKGAVENNFGTRRTPVTNEDGQKVVEGLKSGMESGAGGIENYTKQKVADPVMDGIRKPFGISGGQARQFADFGKQSMEGLKTGIANTAQVPMKAMQEITAKLCALFKNVKWNDLGIDSVKGIAEGIVRTAEAVINAVKDLVGKMSDFIKNVNWSEVGSTVIKGIATGLSQGPTAVMDSVRSIAEDIAEAFQDFDWFYVGDCICGGIQRGMFKGWRFLTETAWNMAVDIFNTACNALGVHSPSKKFEWIANMITSGLVGGIEKTRGDAVDAVSATADAVTAEAENAIPVIPIDTALDSSLTGLDETMMNFAEKIVGGFDSMISALQAIVERATFDIPQTAMGAVAPYSAKADTGEKENPIDTETIMQLISAQNADRLTREDLIEVLTAIANDYFNFEFYLGDEQVARSANRGNVRLNRRFSPST